MRISLSRDAPSLAFMPDPFRHGFCLTKGDRRWGQVDKNTCMTHIGESQAMKGSRCQES
jgi:hypothetical protein